MLCTRRLAVFLPLNEPFCLKKKSSKYCCQSQRLHSHATHFTSPVVLMAVIKQRKQFTTHLLSWFKSRKSESVSTSEESEAEMKPTEEEQDVVFFTACMWHTTLHIHQVL